MSNLFVSIPSARGILPDTMWNVFDMRTALEEAGHQLHGASVYRMPLDLARSELATVFLSTTCDVNLLLDDDVQIDARWIVRLVEAVGSGCDVLSVPCRLRDHSHGGTHEMTGLFNVRPVGMPVDRYGLRLLECESTGLGAVLVQRKVMERLFEVDKKYLSRLMPGRDSAAIFMSSVEPARSLVAAAPPDANVLMLDDMIFSLKLRKENFLIHAAFEASSTHDGMAGCFADEMEKIDRARQRAASREKPLLGPDGKPVR